MPRAVEEINTEYVNTLFKAGEKGYLIKLKKEELEKLEYDQDKLQNQAQTLSNEYHKALQEKPNEQTEVTNETV